MSDWSFRFDPVAPAVLIVAGFAAAAFVIVWSARRTREEAGPARARLLVGLRLAAAALIALALLAPTARVYLWSGERGRIVLLADDSESMTIPDASGGDLARTDALKAALSGSGGLMDRLSRTAGVTLHAFGESLREVAEADELAARDGATDLAGALSRVSQAHRGAPAAHSTSSGRRPELRRGAAGEDREGERAVAAVLLSDGADTEHGDIDSVLAKLARAGLPVYAVATGGAEFRDVEVSGVRATRLVRKDTLVKVAASVRSRGMGSISVPVRLVEVGGARGGTGKDEGGRMKDEEGRPHPSAFILQPFPQGGSGAIGNDRLIAEKEVALGSTARVVEFEFLPAEAGFREYAVEVPLQENEAVRRNNRREFALTVERRKIRVLYMEGSEYRRPERKLWEFQYLEEALREDGDIEVTSLLRKEAARAREAGIYTVQDPEHGFPRTKKGLFEYDVIISSDIDIEFFAKDQLENTVEFVGRRGGGFVMIGGWTAFGPGGYDESVIDRILPVDMTGRFDGYRENEEFTLEPTEEGLRHPIMRLDPDLERNRAIWGRCPPFYGHNFVQRAKPAATVLALHGHGSARNLYGRHVILAVQQYGRGRAMAMTTDSTAGWGTSFEEEFGEDAEDGGRDNRHFKKFWQNAVRWLAEYRLSAPSRLVQLELPAALVGRGEKVRAKVRALDESYEPATGVEVTVRITGPAAPPAKRLRRREAAGEVKETGLASDPAKPGEFATDLTFTELGRHTVEAFATLEGASLGSDKISVSVRPSAKEFENPEVNAGLLRRIAERTGGKFYTLDEVDRLPEDLGDIVASLRRYEDRPLWDRWWYWCMLVAVLCVEWFVRKRAGMP